MIKNLLHNVVQVVKSSPTVCTIIKWFAPPTTTHYFGFVMHSMNIFCVYSHFLHRVLLSCQYHHDDAVYSMSWTSIIVPLGFFFLFIHVLHTYIYTSALFGSSFSNMWMCVCLRSEDVFCNQAFICTVL